MGDVRITILGMRKKDTLDVLSSLWAVLFDAIAVFGGFMLATWIRFDSGLVPILWGNEIPDLYSVYGHGAAVGVLIFLGIFRSLGLYDRPQIGRFENKIPRIIRAIGVGLVISIVLNFLVVNIYTKIASITYTIAFFTLSVCVLLERYILFRLELHYARHSPHSNSVLILGTDDVAAHLMRGLDREPKHRAKVIGFMRTDLSEPSKDVPKELIKGVIDELGSFVEENEVNQIILTNPDLGHKKIVKIILYCEQNLIKFNMVPDLFRILTSSMDVQEIDDIPMLGVSKWPLDLFWNRRMKRMEDIFGALVGIVLTAPIVGLAALFIKKDSPGGVFYKQERCGEQGRTFMLYKLRTMCENAEDATGPVFTAEDDPRKTRTGDFLRKHNIDELPQLWNVLKGDMSLVGPRPERPHFVEQFKEDIGRYMWRHVSKPGLTGWAQVNGLRGNTSIEERIKYDLYYLENWSLAFDFKILMKTVFAKENAY